MPWNRSTLTLLAVLCAGCGTVQQGDRDVQRELRYFKAVPDKISLYVCRPIGGYGNGGVVTTVLVDGIDIGSVKRNSFVHSYIEPGKHIVMMKSDGLALRTPSIDIEAKAGDVKFLWIGTTGGGLGAYTIDTFPSSKDGENCVLDASYMVKPSKKV